MKILEIAKKHKFTIFSGLTCVGLSIGGLYVPYLFIGAGVSLAITVGAGIKECRKAFPERHFIRQEIDARISEIAQELEPGMIESLAVALVMQRQSDMVQASREGQSFPRAHHINEIDEIDISEGFVPLFNSVRNNNSTMSPAQDNDLSPDVEGSTSNPRPIVSAV